jgi:hypothetical protein
LQAGRRFFDGEGDNPLSEFTRKALDCYRAQVCVV